MLTSDTNKINGVNIWGNPDSIGLNMAVRGAAALTVNQIGGGIGNVQQIGNLLMGNSTLTVGGANNYRLQVAGTTTLEGAGSTFSLPSVGGVNGSVILA